LILDNCWGDPWIHTVTFHLGIPPTNPSKFALYLNENAELPLVAKPLVAPPTKQRPETLQFMELELVAAPLEIELLDAELPEDELLDAELPEDEPAIPLKPPTNCALAINCPVACCSGLYIKSTNIDIIEKES
jgi:hypothetical protein